MTTYAEALAAPPRPNREGLVVRAFNSNRRVKIKQADYIRMHRAISGLTTRALWEVLANGGSTNDILKRVPEEFHDWVESHAHWHLISVAKAYDAALARYSAFVDSLPEGWSRKDFAIAAQNEPHKSILFSLLDGKNIMPALWRQIRPEEIVKPSIGGMW